MFKRIKKLAAVAAVAVAAGLGSAQTASAGIAPTSYGLDTFLPGGSNEGGIVIGDKQYSNFNFSSTGDTVLDASDVELIFTIEGNTHFMAILLDLTATSGQTSDVVIGYDLNVLHPTNTINSVGLLFDGMPRDDGNGFSAASVIETVRTLDDEDLGLITVFNDGDGDRPDNFDANLEVNGARGLRFTKDILVSARQGTAGAAISIVENSVTQTVIPLPAAVWAAMRERGVRPIQNLCGHGVGRYLVHCPPAVLNVPEPGAAKLEAGMVVAIEPFATTGRGTAVERGTAEVFRLAPEREVRATVDGEVLAAMRAFKGLPFARRQLAALPRERVEEALNRLRRAGDVYAYPPLVEESGHPVAQAEHTVYVGADGLEVLTR